MNSPIGRNAAMRRSQWFGYFLAVLLTVITLWLRSLMTPWVGERPVLILFIIPIILCAYAGGLGPGLFCSAIVGLGTAYFVMPPVNSFAFEQPVDFAQWLLLVLIGVIISILLEELRRSRRGLDTVDRKYLATERKVQFGFGVALACLAVIGVASYLSVTQLNENSAWASRSKDVIGQLNSLLAIATDAETAQRGYVVTGNETYLDPYRQAKERVDAALRKLHVEIADNPAQLRRFDDLAPLIMQRLANCANLIELRRTEGFAAAQKEMAKNEGKQLHDRLRRLIGEMTQADESLLAAREDRARRSSNVTQAIILGGGVIAFGFVGLALFAIRRDFSGRQRAEAELERFFSLSLDFLCIASSDGYFKRVSPAVTDILGWSVTEFLSRPFIEFVHPDDQHATLQEVEKQMVAGEKVLHFENRYRHKDGSWRVLSWRSMPQPDGLMYATARDVTELKHAELILRDAKEQLEVRVNERTAELAQAAESLRSSERRFRALIEHGSDSISLIDADNKILYLSPAVTAVEGYLPEELLGRSGIEHTHPEDLPYLGKTVQTLIANPGKPIPVLWRRRHKQGHWIWLEGIATNMLDEPSVQAIVTNYRDVTERKEAENKLQAQLARLALLSQITRAIGERQDIKSIFQVVIRTLEEQLPTDFACICLYDSDTNSLTVTSVGLHSAKLAMELALTEQAHVEIDENGLSQCVRGSLVYEPDIRDVQFPFPQRLARGGLHAMVAAPLLNENRVFGVLITARSQAMSFSSGECEFLRQLSEHVALAAHQAQLYTSLQVAYADLRQTQQAVMQQESLRVLGQMASGIAHDINNAISPVTLYTESLLEQEQNLSPRARRYLQTIQQAIGDVAETVKRMREFYRQREPQTALQPVPINTLISQVVELTRARWFDIPQQRGIDIGVQTELATEPPPIMGVESEIRDALTNLIFNAVDAMPTGGTLTLRTRVVANPNTRKEISDNSTTFEVCLEVIDTGIGMDEETRRRCLELFFTTKGERGTGLGLAMVYGMAQRHNAELEVESSLGKGTCIRLTFAASRVTAQTSTITEYRVPQQLRILIVDDDPVLLKSLCDTLQGDGYTIVTANGGNEGIEVFTEYQKNREPFDIVVTDLGMPFVDGRKVAAAIKTASPSTPIIMLTGWGQRLSAEGEMPPHVDRVLSKPPKLSELRSTFAEMFAKT